jgi:hypothetical protein
MHAIQLDKFWISRGGIDLAGPGIEQFLRKCQTKSSVCACYECN